MKKKKITQVFESAKKQGQNSYLYDFIQSLSYKSIKAN